MPADFMAQPHFMVAMLTVMPLLVIQHRKADSLPMVSQARTPARSAVLIMAVLPEAIPCAGSQVSVEVFMEAEGFTEEVAVTVAEVIDDWFRNMDAIPENGEKS
jgi:hypothetical protein